MRHGRRGGQVPGCTDQRYGLDDKLFLEEGKTASWQHASVTVEPGTCMVFDPNTTNAYIMDGNSNNANAIWLRNWREVGLENARKTGGWCIQVLVAGGPSEMQRAEESMAGVRATRSSSYTSTRRGLRRQDIEPYLMALFEAMKTKPRRWSGRSPTTGGGRAQGQGQEGRGKRSSCARVEIQIQSSSAAPEHVRRAEIA